ncbi:peptidoglycan-binding protein LysM [Bifidobacterium sp. DSM 109958]|uniref:Peptidoglycan-binding protein LysM n=1 Tax=Bifidobacterium moraviense TaxID=2675323 RepID=A0A7Y0F2L6_9BIFI|nr:LysM peptidoglycan-binding domain-containing protein [Bifidobacterium sp. DSM 109958]NMN00905.1 peptidoglycan-binding protein LysM [Bifidobacterium sp. DSM 109958]
MARGATAAAMTAIGGELGNDVVGHVENAGGETGRRRGGAVRDLLAAACVGALCMCLMVAPMVHRAWGVDEPRAFVAYTVQPGDTLWGYAVRATPAGGDVNDSVDARGSITSIRSRWTWGSASWCRSRSRDRGAGNAARGSDRCRNVPAVSCVGMVGIL